MHNGILFNIMFWIQISAMLFCFRFLRERKNNPISRIKVEGDRSFMNMLRTQKATV